MIRSCPDVCSCHGTYLTEDEQWALDNTFVDWSRDLLWWAVNQSWPDWAYGRIDGLVRA